MTTSCSPPTAHHRTHPLGVLRLLPDHPMIVLFALIAVAASACGSHPAAAPDPQSLIDRTPGLVQPAAIHAPSTETKP